MRVFCRVRPPSREIETSVVTVAADGEGVAVARTSAAARDDSRYQYDKCFAQAWVRFQWRDLARHHLLSRGYPRAAYNDAAPRSLSRCRRRGGVVEQIERVS